jgi:hypothetical protein
MLNQAVKYGIEMHLFEKRLVRLIRKKLFTFVWIRFELIQSSSFMHPGSALGYPPPKTTASVRSVVAVFITVTISKRETDPLNDIFHSVLS